jgi:hypothetical protein
MTMQAHGTAAAHAHSAGRGRSRIARAIGNDNALDATLVIVIADGGSADQSLTKVARARSLLACRCMPLRASRPCTDTISLQVFRSGSRPTERIVP